VSSGVRILLADDHAQVRRGVRLILDDSSGPRVVAEASDSADAVQLARSEDVDPAVLDVTMPPTTDPQAAREITRRTRHPKC
jgi:DNA-binding NarL/FixJ family response regulator